MLDLINYDALFAATPTAEVLPLPDLATQARIKEFVAKVCASTDRLGFSASCENGCTTGNFYTGMTCPKCHTLVRETFTKELCYRTWLDIPDFAPPVLHPNVYYVISNVFPSVKMGEGIPPRPLLDVIMDNEADLPADLEDRIPQGMRAFHEHFGDIITAVIEHYTPLHNSARYARVEHLKLFLHKFSDRLFVRKLPILDPSLHLLTKYGGVTKADQASPIVINAITTLSGLIHAYNVHHGKEAVLDQQLFKFYEIWIPYAASILNDKVIQKKGLCRKCVLGTRTHCSFRGVISPIIVPHESDELHVPWKVGVNLLKLEIINVLVRRKGMSFTDALNKFFTAETSFDQDIYQVILTLIKECPFKGLPTLFGRNPSIHLGAEQLLFITKVDTNLDNSAIQISPHIVKACNADFDGDNMNGLAIKEMDMALTLMPLHPMSTMLGGQQPGITENVMLTEQEIVILQAYLKETANACKS